MSQKQESRYKNTLNLPQTDFPMKGDLPKREPLIIENWKNNKIYEKLLQKNANCKIFAMPDGPPYANGDLHLGHVLNKVLKDIVIKHRNMSGHLAPFIPGWDCHGLPIEHKVTKDLGPKAKDKTPEQIRELCRAEALKWVDRQRTQFVRLGILADWENPYLTLAPEYEAEEVRELGRVLNNGTLYLGEKPVYWCIPLQTALAEAEVEYQQHKSPAIYVKFTLKGGKEKFKLSKDPALVIWTTTPWTLPANLGIALHPDYEYGIYEVQGDYLIFAKELADSVAKDTQLTLTSLNIFFKGKDLEHSQAQHPFINRESLVILGDHVTLETGTGCVHTAPGHGQEDYIVGQKYNLPILSPVDHKGCYTEEFAEMQGMMVFDANPLIVQKLRDHHALLAHREIEHSYPHCWRSKAPLIYRATPQWFISMDSPENNIRERALDLIDNKIKFYPEWGRQRLRAMVAGRPDWCLSRQRTWGVPIPVFFCEDCHHPLASSELMYKVADAMEKGRGIETYWSTPTAEFVGDTKCQKCNGSKFSKGTDILDVWFDSGICHAAVQRKRKGLTFPADIYLEGSDQHRGWFQTSLLSSMASNGESPFKALLTHGFVTDPQGRKMSKSLGNFIDPLEITKNSGAEILRLWVAYVDYSQDVGCGPETIKLVSDTYRRFRNTLRYLLSVLNDFDIKKDAVAFKDMPVLDKWALAKLTETTEKINQAYQNYEFNKVYHTLNLFITVDLSATYLDVLKDRLYTGKKTGLPRRASQTVVHIILQHLTTMMAPILSFLAEEAYQALPHKTEESVFLTPFPDANLTWQNADLIREFESLIKVREEANKALENLRAEKVIGSGLEAKIQITADDEQFDLLKKYQDILPELFIVSQVSLEAGSYSLKAQQASGEKCERCWHYSESVNQDQQFPGACQRCVEALS